MQRNQPNHDHRRRQGARIIFEMVRIGAYVKVSAIDEQTGEEVTIVGGTAYSKDYMQRLALRKLRQRQQQRGG